MIIRSQSAHRSSERAVRPSRTLFRRFLRDSSGSVVVQMLIFSLLVFAMAGLVLTVGRLYVINTASQAYVDQIALAAAAELDNRSDSIERARRAAFGATSDPDDPDGVLKKQTPFGEGVEDLIEVEELMFLSELPRDQGYQYEVGDLPPFFTTEPTKANYVVVIARPISIFSVLLPVTTWTSEAEGVLETRSVAVASLEREICDRPMFMVCNPFETATEGDDDSFADNIERFGEGYQVMVTRHSGGGQTWSPGNFGTIDLDGYFDPADIEFCKGGNPNATPLQLCLMGVNIPAVTCAGSTINLDPGNGQRLLDGFNVRFDIWSQQMSGYRSDSRFPPDYVVTKGLSNGLSPAVSAGPSISNDCKPAHQNSGPPRGWEDAPSMALPRADCFDNWQVDCPSRITDYSIIDDATQMDELVDYFNTNHKPYTGDTYKRGGDSASGYYVGLDDGSIPATPVQVPVLDPEDGSTVLVDVDTRYKAYLWEANQLAQYAADTSTGTAPATKLAVANPVPASDTTHYEHMVPVCKPWGASMVNPGVPGRRVIVSAVVNCIEWEPKGNAEGIPVEEYILVFATEPVVNNDLEPQDDDLYAEIIRVFTPDVEGAKVHEYPVLNR